MAAARGASADPLGGIHNLGGMLALLVLVLAIAIAAEGVVIVVEALAYHVVGGLRGIRALGTSITANCASLTVGLFTLYRVSPGWPRGVWGLAICLAVEAPIVMIINSRDLAHNGRKAAESPARDGRRPEAPSAQRLLATSVLVNLATYSGLTALIALLSR